VKPAEVSVTAVMLVPGLGEPNGTSPSRR
jgi:hypothetical protein